MGFFVIFCYFFTSVKLEFQSALAVLSSNFRFLDAYEKNNRSFSSLRFIKLGIWIEKHVINVLIKENFHRV